MTSVDDFYDEMLGGLIDSVTADALLGGELAPDDAPPGLHGVAALVQAARGAARPEELRSEDDVVARLVAMTEPVVAAEMDEREATTSLLRHVRLVKVVPVATAALLVGSVAVAAAATGYLPGLRHATAAHEPAHSVTTNQVSTVTSAEGSTTSYHPMTIGSRQTATVVHRPAAPVARGPVPVGAGSGPSRTGGGSTSGGGGGDSAGAGGAGRTHHGNGGSGTHHSGPAPGGGGSGGGSGSTSVTGVVTFVGGVSAEGTCGAAGVTGTFTLASPVASSGAGGTTSVEVSATTSFTDPAVGDPTYVEVCIGAKVLVVGSSPTKGTIDATAIAVAPPAADKAAGFVVAVDGSGAAGTCGSASAAGTFTVTGTPGPGSGRGSGPFAVGVRHNESNVIVSVASSTTFLDPADPSPSFADICVGGLVAAAGGSPSVASLDASTVRVFANTAVSGTVTSVDGSSAAGDCGTAGAGGSFTIEAGGMSPGNGSMADTVDVSTITKFDDPAVADASFAEICVGDLTFTIGTTGAGGAIRAIRTRVHAQSTAAPAKIGGVVTSVGGSSRADACGSSGARGSFTIAVGGTLTSGASGTNVTVRVSTTTVFHARSGAAATYGSVCVGDFLIAKGTWTSSTGLAATAVVLRGHNGHHVARTTRRPAARPGTSPAQYERPKSTRVP